jgi:hypothetical protein
MSERESLAAVETPNLFTLHGDGLAVTLSLSGIDGRPHLTYQDAQRSLSFTGDEITFEDTVTGHQASVVVVRTVDGGSTAFTVLVPRINLIGTSEHVVHTVGITTIQRTTIAGLGRGQLTTYTVTQLGGSASKVQF